MQLLGKSTFIHLLTRGDDVDISHCSKSEVSDVETAYYTDARTGRTVMLIETPGFDDSQEGITDTDILRRIIDFLQPPIGERVTLNGIILLHCISEPCVGGLSRKNLQMFEAICGEKCLLNVHIVTTNWDRVTEEEGNLREDELKKGAFQALLKGGAQMRHHANTVDSARRIISELIPLQDVTTQLQDQIVRGTPLVETDAGRIINQDLEELRGGHAEELSNAQKEMKEVGQAHGDDALRAELDAKCKVWRGRSYVPRRTSSN
ncbi:hypothetical protein JVU11DRAFT_8477 [Chiua virens]|nr:hypothetical protein JVU11DRAFT_8477 [Chiua virens]